MDVRSSKRKSSPEQRYSDKRHKHEIIDVMPDEASNPSHRDCKERHSKHGHKHKRHRHGHGSHRKHKHDHRRKSSRGTEDMDTDGMLSIKGEKAEDGHQFWAGKVAGEMGKKLDDANVIRKQNHKEEGEISEDQTLNDLKVAAESEIESGEIKSDEESAKGQPSFQTSTVGRLTHRSKEENEAVLGKNMMEADTFVAGEADLSGVACLDNEDIGYRHTVILTGNNMANSHAFSRHSSDDNSRRDTCVNDSHMFRDFSKETSDVELSRTQLTVGETLEENSIQSDSDNAGRSGKSAFEDGDQETSNYYYESGVAKESLIESHFPKELIQSPLGGSINLEECLLKDEKALLTFKERHNDHLRDTTRSMSSPDHGKSKNSKSLVASGSGNIKLQEGKSFQPEEFSLCIDESSDARRSFLEEHQSSSRDQTIRHKIERKRRRSREEIYGHKGERKRSHSSDRDKDERRRSRSGERTHMQKGERNRSCSREPTRMHQDDERRNSSCEATHRHKNESKRSHSREMPHSRSHEQRLSLMDERKQNYRHEASGSHLFDKNSVPSRKRRSHSRESHQSLSRGAVHAQFLQEETGGSRNHTPPSRSTHSKLQKDSEVYKEQNKRSRLRDLTFKSHIALDSQDRLQARESLKGSKDAENDQIRPSRSHAYSPENCKRRSRSRDSLKVCTKEIHEPMSRGHGHTASPRRRQRSRSRDNLKDGRSEGRGLSRYDRPRERDHIITHKSNRSSRERYKDEEHGSRYSESSHGRNRREYLNHDVLKTDRHSSKKAPEFSLEDKTREEENQEVYVERVSLQLAAQEEDDVEKIKEESRRRRQAILEKYKNQKREQQESKETSTDVVRDVPSAREHAGEARVGGSIVFSEVGRGKQNGAVNALGQDIFDESFVHGAAFVLGKRPSQKESSSIGNVGGIIGLGEGSPKSERSAGVFCDDIFGESPAGGHKVGKGDGLAIDHSSLIDNWDDAEGYYCYRIGEVLDGRYEIASSHGRGVFSHVVRARDLKAGRGDAEEVAIKIIRNNETMFKAGQTELIILKKLAGADPDNRRHCVRLLSSFEYRSHLCLVFESLHMNLREVLKKFGRNIGINLHAVRAYAKQLFIGLKHLRNCGVLHCDIKPDNMLVNEAKNVLKLCDFGSAMFAGENEITPYLVSRFYRAPEIILGLPYDHSLDIWSVGCCLYELYTGKVLFPGPTNNDMLKLHMELKGPFPKKMLKKAAFKDQHFDQDYNFCAVEEDPVTKKMVKRILANVKPLDIGALISRSGTIDEDSKMVVNFKDLLDKIFILDPDKRMTVSQALNHPFITGK